jgi:excisionase family DNA binding protein
MESRLVHGQVAQLVEHATENRGVGGSIPPLATSEAVRGDEEERGMARERPEDAPQDERAARPRGPEPIPLDPMSLLAGLAPGVTLEADTLPAGVVGNAEPQPATVSVEEVARLLRCGEATIRRLIRSAVLRPVEIDGATHVRRADVDAYRNAFLPRSPRKPGE